MSGDQFINFFICPFVLLLSGELLRTSKSVLRVDGPLFDLAVFERDGERDCLLPDYSPCKQVECCIRAQAKLVAELVKLFLDVGIKAD